MGDEENGAIAIEIVDDTQEWYNTKYEDEQLNKLNVPQQPVPAF